MYEGPTYASTPPQESYSPQPPPPPPPPPRKKGRWLLGCCGGCLVVTLLMIIGVWVWADRQLKQVGPINPTTVAQKLGNDVPTYPNAVIDTNTTYWTVLVTRMFGQKVQEAIEAMVFFRTADKPDQVFDWYDRELKKRGWKEDERTPGSGLAIQRLYRKGNGGVMVQVQAQPGQGTMIVIFKINKAPSGSQPASEGEGR